MTITLSFETLLVGSDFAGAITGPYRSHGEVEILPSGKRLKVLSTENCANTSDALIRAMRKEGVRGNIMTQAL
jgi:hypothetical protein